MLAACGSSPPAALLNVSGTGNATEAVSSSSAAGWNMEWSYDCSKTGGRGIFVVDVYDSDHTPDFNHPGVSEEGDQDAGVYHVPGSGRFYLEITTTCRWTLKVVSTV